MRTTRASRFVSSPHGQARPAFTLIELLVVISIVALLMALLMPALSRVRKQARSTRCQANLRQWGAILALYQAENDGLLPWWILPNNGNPDMHWYWGTPLVFRSESGWKDYDPPLWYNGTNKGILCCPTAAKPANTTGQGDPWGGTFLAWGFGPDADPREDRSLWGYGSYGRNDLLSSLIGDSLSQDSGFWQPHNIKTPANIPVILDSAWRQGGFYDVDSPPRCDAIATWDPSVSPPWRPFCIDRHDGSINGLFLDWSVRRVGLKELWTLKWNRKFATAGKWTKAGGVQPEDWPEWMRRFKDY